MSMPAMSVAALSVLPRRASDHIRREMKSGMMKYLVGYGVVMVKGPVTQVRPYPALVLIVMRQYNGVL